MYSEGRGKQAAAAQVVRSAAVLADDQIPLEESKWVPPDCVKLPGLPEPTISLAAERMPLPLRL